jgi:hypothetical protein
MVFTRSRKIINHISWNTKQNNTWTKFLEEYNFFEMLILSFCNRQRFVNNFSIVVVIIIDIYFAFIYQFLFLKFWWSFSNCNTTLILNTVIVCLNCSTFNSFVFIVIFYFDKSVTVLYHLVKIQRKINFVCTWWNMIKYSQNLISQFRISLFYGYHKVKIVSGSKSC